jgi:hypothetical protein
MVFCRLEVDAYGRLVSVVRAKGGVSGDGGRLLREAASLLDISAERAKAEIRRVTSSELLATIAYKYVSHVPQIGSLILITFFFK